MDFSFGHPKRDFSYHHLQSDLLIHKRGPLYDFIGNFKLTNDPIPRTMEMVMYAAQSPQHTEITTQFLCTKLGAVCGYEYLETLPDFLREFANVTDHVNEPQRSASWEKIADQATALFNFGINYRATETCMRTLDDLDKRPELKNYHAVVKRDTFQEAVRLMTNGDEQPQKMRFVQSLLSQM